MQTHHCPICKRDVPESHFACHFASVGGKAGRGEAKARTSEQAKRAIEIRWARWRAQKAKEQKNK